MIAVVLLVVLISSYLIVKALSRTSPEISNARGQRTMNALVQAKAALIAYAASEQWQLYRTPTTYFQPGALPCPDQDNDGDADCWGSVTSSMIGRLPWKTIGADDLRDSSGERLWYAVSHNFRKNMCPGTGCTIINSDTQGQLTVTGATPATNVVAIVFAPGPPIQGQDRIAGVNDVAQYLEVYNLDLPQKINFAFTSSASPSSTFNDQLLIITQADLMAAVEPVVAARIDRDVKPFLQAYATQWSGRYPFPANFANPDPGSSNPYLGDPTQQSGLLPITATPTYPWINGSGSVTIVGGTGVISNVTCSTVSGSPDIPAPGNGWQCSFKIGPAAIFNPPTCCPQMYTTSSVINNPRVRVQGGVQNVGTSLAQLPNAYIVGSNYATSTPSINGTLVSSGNGTARYQATYSVIMNCSVTSSPQGSSYPPPPAGCPTYNVTVTIPDLAPSPVTSTTPFSVGIQGASNTSPITITTSSPHGFSTGSAVTISGVTGNTAANGTWTVAVIDATSFQLNGSTGNGTSSPSGTASPASFWFIQNQWFRQTYYAVSPGFLPGGTGSCSTSSTPFCLTVNNQPPDYTSANNVKRAIMILSGRALNGSTRPSPNLADYLEGQNATPSDLIFEHRQGSTTSINDRVVVVSPSP